jgi:hypothetical protein
VNLTEILMAAAIASLLLAPAFVLFSPAEVQLGAARSRAGRLLALVAERVECADARALRDLCGGLPEGAPEYHEVPLARLGLGAEEDENGLARGLAVTVRVRWVRHLAGRPGLDRLDVRLDYADAKRTHHLVRAVVRRDAALEAAVLSLRALEDTDSWSGEEFRARLAEALRIDDAARRHRRASKSAYTTPTYPTRLASYEEPRREQRSAPEAANGGEVAEPRPEDRTGDEDLLGLARIQQPRFAESIGTLF